MAKKIPEADAEARARTISHGHCEGGPLARWAVFLMQDSDRIWSTALTSVRSMRNAVRRLEAFPPIYNCQVLSTNPPLKDGRDSPSPLLPSPPPSQKGRHQMSNRPRRGTPRRPTRRREVRISSTPPCSTNVAPNPSLVYSKDGVLRGGWRNKDARK